MRKSCCFSEQCSTQSAWKQCGARHARLNRVTRTVAKWFAQSTSEWPKTLPRGSNGPPIGAPPKPNEVGLVGRGGAAERLSFCPERQNEGCGACDDEARLSPLSFFKQRKMVPPEGVGIAERQVKTQAAEFTSAVGQSSHFSQTPSVDQYKSRISRRASLRPHSSSR